MQHVPVVVTHPYNVATALLYPAYRSRRHLSLFGQKAFRKPVLFPSSGKSKKPKPGGTTY
jgi:hypothetical protein